jgi:1-acyl-sn-glycerol-3-phosphate acyltransferase
LKNLSVTSPAYWLAYAPVTHALRFGLRALAPRWHVTGRRNIPARGAAILAPNHIADCDPPFVGLSVYRPLWFMAKRELFEIPVLGKFIAFAQAFPVDRDAPDRAALKHAEELLRAGQIVVVFPEGRLSQSGELQPLLPGALMLALRAKVPVIPVGISGTNQILPYGQVIPRPTLKPVHVHFGAPLSFDDLEGLPARRQRGISAERLETALREAIAVARSGINAQRN